MRSLSTLDTITTAVRLALAPTPSLAVGGGGMDEWTCTAAALEKIIAAVGEKYTDDLDRDRLVLDLQDAWSKWLLFTALDSDKGARARKELFGVIADSAINFRERLLDPRGEMYAARGIFPGRSGLEAFVAELDRVIGAAQDFEEQNSHRGWVRLSRAPKEWMVGEILPDVYERNFHRRASPSRNPNAETADGPYPRFAQAVMAEWGIKITMGVIVRALKEVRKGLPRRKPRPTTLARPKGW